MKKQKLSQATDLADTAIAVGAHLDAELDEALRERGVTRPSFLVLRALAEAPDGTLSQRELGARLRRTAGTLSVRLGRLGRAGMIERTTDPEDRRAVQVAITDRGRALHDAAKPLYDERVERLIGALPDDAADTLAEHLGAWLEFFEPSQGHATRLGVAVVPSSTAARMRRAVGLPERAGVLVRGVQRAGVASRSELRAGDLITAAGSEPVRTVADLERALRRADGTLRLDVVRGVDERAIDVALD